MNIKLNEIDIIDSFIKKGFKLKKANEIWGDEILDGNCYREVDSNRIIFVIDGKRFGDKCKISLGLTCNDGLQIVCGTLNLNCEIKENRYFFLNNMLLELKQFTNMYEKMLSFIKDSDSSTEREEYENYKQEHMFTFNQFLL